MTDSEQGNVSFDGYKGTQRKTKERIGSIAKIIFWLSFVVMVVCIGAYLSGGFLVRDWAAIIFGISASIVSVSSLLVIFVPFNKTSLFGLIFVAPWILFAFYFCPRIPSELKDIQAYKTHQLPSIVGLPEHLDLYKGTLSFDVYGIQLWYKTDSNPFEPNQVYQFVFSPNMHEVIQYSEIQ